MTERSINIKIPLERVGVLIGVRGHVKDTIEKRLGVKIIINSKDGDVNLTSSDPDPSLLFRARDIVLTIGRGFSPEKAFKLLNEDINLCVIDLRELFESISDITRVKSRIIGKAGKTRRILEEETTTSISVYGYTVSIIGDLEHLEVAKEAVEMFIRGVLHRNVYKYLSMKRNDLRKTEMELWKPTPELLNKEEKKHV